MTRALARIFFIALLAATAVHAQQRPQPALEGVRNAWRPVTVTLKPFEVVVYEAIPAMRATENR